MKIYPWYSVVLLMAISLSACSATPEDITQDRRSRADLDRDPNITLKQFQVGDFYPWT